jgi:hypothetical protein
MALIESKGFMLRGNCIPTFDLIEGSWLCLGIKGPSDRLDHYFLRKKKVKNLNVFLDLEDVTMQFSFTKKEQKLPSQQFLMIQKGYDETKAAIILDKYNVNGTSLISQLGLTEKKMVAILGSRKLGILYDTAGVDFVGIKRLYELIEHQVNKGLLRSKGVRRSIESREVARHSQASRFAGSSSLLSLSHSSA